MISRSILAVYAALLVLTAACAQAPPEPANLYITMTEYAFTPGLIELRVGQEVTITLDNQGQIDHEIMFGRQLMSMDGRPSGYSVDLFENAGVTPAVVLPDDIEDHMMEDHGETMHHSGFMVMLPGQDHQATINFTVTEEMLGEWEIGCFLQDGVHYQAGMSGRMIIRP
jgi:plastocyanin